MISDTSALFSPYQLGKLTLKNRIVMSPMTREMSPGGMPGDDVASYYARRANSIGLIITEGVGIPDPAAVDHPDVPAMYGDALPRWRNVVDAVHAEGGLIFPQLWHQGVLRNLDRAAAPDIEGLRPSGLWGTPGVTTYDATYLEAMSRPTAPMSESQIADVIAAFATSARDAIDTGFDGIAIHGAHGYLIDTFFWAETNRRTDRYGGDIRARARFGAEVVAAIRAEIGPDATIMFRFSNHKQQDFKACIAATPDELGIVLGALTDAGVDLFDASARRFNMPGFAGSDLPLAGWARKLTGKPCMAVGGIGLNNNLVQSFIGTGETLAENNLPEVSRRIAEGEFDMAGVGRALLNDPDWARRAANGDDFLTFDRDCMARLT
ncbi:12-oxophytodienoate reductase [Sphingorhabdus sp.]|jgi:2,4-dienoyl-CoA reductase-like NADH-dependent reductase (Old Yellow Enzyme family)|uniref:oxidoreductase n=1 Tax=Sphingorhabdus sp. TaxID=1902408 RepID=UPI0037CB065D